MKLIWKGSSVLRTRLHEGGAKVDVQPGETFEVQSTSFALYLKRYHGSRSLEEVSEVQTLPVQTKEVPEEIVATKVVDPKDAQKKKAKSKVTT